VSNQCNRRIGNGKKKVLAETNVANRTESAHLPQQNSRQEAQPEKPTIQRIISHRQDTAALIPQNAGIDKTVALRVQARTRPSTVPLSTDHATGNNQPQSETKVLDRPTELTGPFTQTDMIAAWKAYASQLPDSSILMKTMMEQCVPRQLEDNDYEVAVYHQTQMKNLNDELIKLRPFLTETLKNNLFSLSVRLQANPAIETKRQALTSAGQFAAMQEKNPELSRLKDLFMLELE
jgi:hypothetical protein